ncbi:hypothetical protein OROGR_031073 [Orobanche gracilis]
MVAPQTEGRLKKKKELTYLPLCCYWSRLGETIMTEERKKKNGLVDPHGGDLRRVIFPERIGVLQKVPEPAREETEEDRAKLVGEQKDDEKGAEKPKTSSNSTFTLIPDIPLPFPQRFKKNKLDAQFSKFLEIFKKININIPFAGALEQMSNYAKYLKDVISKKRRLGDYETVMLTEESSTVIQRKLPQKLKDPGSFTVPCTIGSLSFKKALCDLGASINLMPLSIFRKIGVGEMKATSITLQLADRSVAYPRGIVEDVLVKVDKFILSTDFVVLEMDEDGDLPLILGCPFLATGRALIDVEKGELTLRVNDEHALFSIFKSMKFQKNVESCHILYSVDPLYDSCDLDELELIDDMFALDSLKEETEHKKFKNLQQETDTVVSILARSCQKWPRNTEKDLSIDTTRDTVVAAVVSVVVSDQSGHANCPVLQNSHPQTSVLDLNLLLDHPKNTFLSTNHINPLSVSYSSHRHAFDTG